MHNQEILTGNAAEEGQQSERHGWFLGHFLPPEAGLRATRDVELKWGRHARGEQKTNLASNSRAATISILISGRFQVDFPDLDQSVLLEAPGDYVLFAAGIVHRWIALEDTVILSMRWPSLPGDQTSA